MKQITECGCGCNGAPANCQNNKMQNYMFFRNLQVIKTAIDSILEMDQSMVDQMLSAGHDWAVDHIATAVDDVEEVYHFLTTDENNGDSYNSQEPQFVPVNFGNHLKQIMGERIERRDGKWVVKPKTGNHVLGTHPTKKAALKQLAAIEISKHRK